MSDIQVIYEDEGVLAVNKPAGVVVHSDDHHKDSFTDSVKEICPSAELLHRLDKDTSGVLLFSKTPAAYEYYKSLFHDRKVRKEYMALVVGKVKGDGRIDLSIGRSSTNPKKRVVGGGKGRLRDAHTEYCIKERFDEYTLLSVFPKTGRTHQVRSHLASIGHPVACDELYGGKRYKCPGTRQMLHAFGLEFPNMEGKGVKVEADLPEDFSRALRNV